MRNRAKLQDWVGEKLLRQSGADQSTIWFERFCRMRSLSFGRDNVHFRSISPPPYLDPTYA